jgi:glyoxylase-like metal-dependent hydrolase (beta-lactamase superfamily II)
MQLFDSAHIHVRGFLVLRNGGIGRVCLGVRFGLIDRGADGLCLVDTGYGPTITSGDGRSRAVRAHNTLLSPTLIDANQPAAVLARLGKSSTDVRTIVLTHFHPDHVANLAQFPHARIIASAVAAKAIAAMGTVGLARHGVLAELLPPDVWNRITPIEDCALKPTWTRLNLGHDIFGDGSYLAIPLPGHALGHHGLFWREAHGPVCYGADVTWTLEALKENRAARFSRFLVFANRKAGSVSETLLRAFIAEGGEVRLCHEIVGQSGV